MAWEKNRPTHVPKNVRDAALKRDGNQCVAQLHDGTRCPATTNLEADEIYGWVPGKKPGVSDIQTLCTWHHNRKTQREAARARRTRPSALHPREPHPGLS